MSVILQCEFETWDIGTGAYDYLVPSIVGAELTSQNKKIGNKSLLISGGGYAYTPNMVSPQLNELTVQAWINPTSLPSDQYGTIIGAWNSDSAGDCSFRFLVSSSGELRFQYLDISGAYPSIITDPGVIIPSAWSHISVEKSSASNLLFVNGILKAKTAGTAAIRAANANFALGRTVYNDSWHYSGYIDSLQVSNTALYPESGFTPNTAPFTPVAQKPVFIGGSAINSMDLLRGGNGVIRGTVKVHGSVTDAPAARKVGLFLRRTLERVAITWSDPVTGAYAFSGLQLVEPYFVCGLDHTLAFDGVLHDNIYAEAS